MHPDASAPAGRLLLRELLLEPESRRHHRLETDARLRDAGLCGALIEASQEVVHDDPWRTVSLARLAVHLADLLPAGGGKVLGAQAALALANGLRAAGELVAAEQGFADGEARIAALRNRTAIRQLRAYLWDLRASLRADQRRFPEAIALLEGALTEYRSLGDREGELKALIQRGYLLNDSGQAGPALRSLRQAVALLDPRAHPRLLVVLLHNLVQALNRLGYSISALSLLSEVKELHRRQGFEIPLLRCRWLEAEVLQSVGKRAEAERILEELRREFLARDLPFDAALACLELAALYLEDGRTYKLRALATQMFPIFQSQKVHREAMAALILFRESLDTHTADLRLVRELAVYLQQARIDRALRFRAPG
jgi:tetratricopeptide (TPR) repeat protein